MKVDDELIATKGPKPHNRTQIRPAPKRLDLQRRNKMKINDLKRVTFLLLVVIATLAHGQANGEYGNYQDYADNYAQQDNLYSDYALKQQQKKGAAGGAGVTLTGVVSAAVTFAFGYNIGGRVHSNRAVKALKKKHMKDQKTLYSQYYNDVYKLQQQNAELAYVVEQYQEALKKVEEDREMDAMQRDYDEFKQPDLDGDDRISRAEFNMYVKNYLSNYPGLTENDYPKFEDFDHDNDGYIGFQEYAQQMALTLQQAENEKSNSKTVGY